MHLPLLRSIAVLEKGASAREMVVSGAAHVQIGIEKIAAPWLTSPALSSRLITVGSLKSSGARSPRFCQG